MASKGAINLQLNIDTQFKNVNTAVANFQKALSNIKIDNNFLDTKNIANTFQSQITEIQKSLSEAANFKLSDSSLGDYQALLKSIQNQYSSLKSSVIDYQVALDNSKDAVQAQIAQEIQAANVAKNKATSLNQRKGILDELEACITHTFYKNEDDATSYYQDRISRKKDLGGKYNEKFFAHIQEEGDEFVDNEGTDVDATAGGGEE